MVFVLGMIMFLVYYGFYEVMMHGLCVDPQRTRRVVGVRRIDWVVQTRTHL